ncbi:nucleopolyhedrovirus P10 family protein [Streptomyces sp. NPDC056716]|uniref:nucleopolyhedrovirus P10 family protein n=1 Tax=unclassified Streptomyces TaxID=2593676 RepID=UPI0036A71C23
MTEQWARVVRQQVGLGRLLPLGGARDGAWITEGAAADVLRRAGDEVPGVRLAALRIAPAEPGPTHEPAVPPPPSALPPGPLRVSADFSATGAEPLPVSAGRLRGALARAASKRLGLTVTEVDLRVTALLETDDTEESASVRPSGPRPAGEAGSAPPSAPAPSDGPVATERPDTPGDHDAETTDEQRVTRAALTVPGVTRLTGTLGGLGRAVHIDQRGADRTNTRVKAVPRRHIRVEIAVDREHRTVEVARKVRSAVGGAVSDRPSVAVLVTAVD